MDRLRRFLDRHFPALWWCYPRGRYRVLDLTTWHHRNDVVERLTTGVRRCAVYFWWCFGWGAVWTAAAVLVAKTFDVSFLVSMALFVCGSWEGRMYKEQRKALLELRGREADLVMAKEFRAAGQREVE